MFQKVKEFRVLIVYTLLILISLGSLNSLRKDEIDMNWHDRLVLFITTPVQSAVTFTLRGANGILQNYLFLVQTREENKFLLEKNRILQSQLAIMNEYEKENQRLRELLKFEKTFPYQKVIAQVVGRDAHPDFRTIRINKGTDDGIKQGMPVVTHEGIVGRILRSSGGVSDVLTILDHQSSVDSLIQRSRTRGIVEGLSESSCQMKYALRTDQVEIGDQVITSGLGEVYPKGVSVGTVTRVEKKNYGVSQSIEIKPSVDFSKLEEVIVLLNVNKDATPKLSLNEQQKTIGTN
jgi:rod shape-determining protein MreC